MQDREFCLCDDIQKVCGSCPVSSGESTMTFSREVTVQYVSILCSPIAQVGKVWSLNLDSFYMHVGCGGYPQVMHGHNFFVAGVHG
jgi:hypothetical protein